MKPRAVSCLLLKSRMGRPFRGASCSPRWFDYLAIIQFMHWSGQPAPMGPAYVFIHSCLLVSRDKVTISFAPGLAFSCLNSEALFTSRFIFFSTPNSLWRSREQLWVVMGRCLEIVLPHSARPPERLHRTWKVQSSSAADGLSNSIHWGLSLSYQETQAIYPT